MTQVIKTIARLLIISGLPIFTSAQSTFLPQGSKFEHFLDRMEILQQRDSELNITTDKPISRRIAVRVSELADSLYHFYPYDDIYHISKVDRQNLRSLLLNNAEWVSGSK